MSNNGNKNKRAITGAIIFIVLIALNLLVRYSRSGESNQPAALPVAPVAQPVSTAPAAPTPSVKTAGRSSNEVAPELVIQGSTQQTQAINNKLEQMRQRLAKVDPPLQPPDLNIDLKLADYDRFHWKQSPVTATTTIFIEPDTGLATTTTRYNLEILGIFKVKGRSKYLVKENSRIFLVNEGEETQTDSIVVEQTSSSSYLVFDSVGSAHELQLAQPQETGVEKALNILQDKSKKQQSFETTAEQPANDPKKLQGTQKR